MRPRIKNKNNEGIVKQTWLNIKGCVKALIFLFFILILIVLPLTGQAVELEKFHARPDQVLVIYNEDWVKDVDGSSPGQDSKEVAEYYIEKHSDSIRSLRPYLLGLKAKAFDLEKRNGPGIRDMWKSWSTTRMARLTGPPSESGAHP